MNKKHNSVIKAVATIVGGLVFVAVAAYIQKVVRPTPEPEVRVERVVEPYEAVICPKDFNVYKQEDKQVVKLISEPKSMFASNGYFVNSQIVVTKNETQDSKIACGYMEVKVHTNDGPLKSYENLYINPNNFGGHLDKSTQFGLGDSNTGSDYLFSLNDIKYWKTKNRTTLLSTDWAALLNVSDKVSFEIALNTQDRSGVIDEMSISYKCWDPETGKENNDCRLQVEGGSDTESSSLQ